MKQAARYVLILLLSLAGSRAYAQQLLAGTAWQGTVRMGRPTEIIFQFKQDTLLMLQAENKRVLETMRYAQLGNQWMWQKLSGGSPCEPRTVGTYKFLILEDKMMLTLVEDACPGRSGALMGAPFRRVMLAAAPPAKPK